MGERVFWAALMLQFVISGAHFLTALMVLSFYSGVVAVELVS